MKKIYILFLGICMGATPLWAMNDSDIDKMYADRERLYKKEFDALKRIRAVTMLGAISTRNQELADQLYSKGINTALFIGDDIRFDRKRNQVEKSDQEVTDFLDSLDPSTKDFVQKFIQVHQEFLGDNKLWERLRMKQDLMLLSDSRFNDIEVVVTESDFVWDLDIPWDVRQLMLEEAGKPILLFFNDSINNMRADKKFSVRGFRVKLNTIIKLPEIHYRRYNLGVPYLLDEAKIDAATHAQVNQELRAYLRVLGPLLIRDFEGTINRLGAILQTPVDQLAANFTIADDELEMFQLPVETARVPGISPTTVGEKAGFNVHLATPRAKIMGLMGIVGAVMLIARKKVKQYTPSLKGIISVPKRYPYISALVVAGLVATAGVGAGKYKRSRE